MNTIINYQYTCKSNYIYWILQSRCLCLFMIGFPDSTFSRVRVSCAHFSFVHVFSLLVYRTNNRRTQVRRYRQPLVEWRSAHVSIEQYVCRRNGEDCTSGNVIGRSCYLKKYSVREPSVSLCSQPYLLLISSDRPWCSVNWIRNRMWNFLGEFKSGSLFSVLQKTSWSVYLFLACLECILGLHS